MFESSRNWLIFYSQALHGMMFKDCFLQFIAHCSHRVAALSVAHVPKSYGLMDFEFFFAISCRNSLLGCCLTGWLVINRHIALNMSKIHVYASYQSCVVDATRAATLLMSKPLRKHMIQFTSTLLNVVRHCQTNEQYKSGGSGSGSSNNGKQK